MRVLNGKRNRNSAFDFAKSSTATLKEASANDVITEATRRHERTLYLPVAGSEFDSTLEHNEGLRFSNGGFRRFCGALNVPQKFIRKVSESNPSLSTAVLNEVIRAGGDNLQYTVLDNVIEGAVSKSYSRVSNGHVAELAADSMEEDKFSRAEFEGIHMRLDWARETRPVDLVVGDTYFSGSSLVHGEDGSSAFSLSGYLLRLVCENGMVANDDAYTSRIFHRGNDLPQKFARALNDIHGFSDTALSAASLARDTLLDENRVRAVMDNVRKTFTVSFANNVLRNAWQEAEADGHSDELSLYNIVNGITYQGHTANSIEQRTNIERYGSRLLLGGLRN